MATRPFRGSELKTADQKRPGHGGWHNSRSITGGVTVVLSCLPWSCLTNISGTEPSSGEILAKVAESSLRKHAVAYSGVREYKLRNYRFEKEATVSVQVTYQPGEGKSFTVVERSGSAKLLEIVEKLLVSEAEASKPAKLGDHEISPANYQACLRGTETVAGRNYYVLDLLPKHKSRYLIKGTAWVDRSSYGIMRLEGTTAASVSMWVGAPHITQEFSQFAGLWLPVHMDSVSSGLLLGASELEISYMDYVVMNLDHPVPTGGADSAQQRQP
jgi:hypothetical protein